MFKSQDEHKPPQRKRKLTSKVLLGAAAAATLVLGALYAPLLWQQTAVAAKPATVTLAAPMAQIDSSLNQDQEALAALYEAVAPSVVNIQVEGTSTAMEMPNIPGFELPPDMQQQPQQSQGSGFIYDNDGHIVTNNHVVDGADKVVVVFNNGMWADAEVVATDPQADLAVIKVTPPEGMEWRPLAVADDSTLKVGHHVIAIGNPFGLEGTMTTGIVSALGRGMPVGAMGLNRYTLPDVIQTDAAINPGNSGGPLLDLNGNVVGVNFAIESPNRSNAGVGFAIPASIMNRVVPALIQDGKFAYPYLGLSGNGIGPDLADALDLEVNKLGVYVSGVVPGGPAEQAGVQGGDETVTTDTGIELTKGGDIVVAIDDEPIQTMEDLVSYLVTKTEPGQDVTLSIIRDGEEQAFTVTLGERPQQTAVQMQSEGKPGANWRSSGHRHCRRCSQGEGPGRRNYQDGRHSRRAGWQVSLGGGAGH